MVPELNKVYCGDFMAIMDSWDIGFRERLLVISDPPYNIGFKYGEYKDKKTENDYINWFKFIGKPCVLIHYPEESMRYFVPALGAPDKSVAW